MRRTVDVSCLRRAVAVVVPLVEREVRRGNWKRLREGSLWYELGACILGSRVTYEVSSAAARDLRAVGLLAQPPEIGNLDKFEKDAGAVLARPRLLKTGRRIKYRFPLMRARHLRQTAEAIYGEHLSIKTLLAESGDPRRARARLIERAWGVGPKQASMFLRNIGFSLDLAVIDVHVLRYLAATSDWAVPSSSEVSSLKRYEMVEERFQQLAKALGTRPGYLDTAVWVVMRTLRREEPRWVS